MALEITTSIILSQISAHRQAGGYSITGAEGAGGRVTITGTGGTGGRVSIMGTRDAGGRALYNGSRRRRREPITQDTGLATQGILEPRTN